MLWYNNCDTCVNFMSLGLQAQKKKKSNAVGIPDGQAVTMEENAFSVPNTLQLPNTQHSEDFTY